MANKRVTFALAPNVAPFPEKFNGNGILNKSMQNILLEYGSFGPNPSSATIRPTVATSSSKANQENEPANCGNLAPPSPNYRLLYQLYSIRKNAETPEKELWESITSSYNFVTGSEYGSIELMKIWNRAPAMTKRKFELDSMNDLKVDLNNKKSKKAIPSKKTPTKAKEIVIDEKPGLHSILKSSEKAGRSTVANNLDQSQPLQKQLKTSKSTAEASSTSLDAKVNSINVSLKDKETQTNIIQDESTNSDNSKSTNADLTRKDMELKVAIMEMKLKILQSQYQRQFGGK